MPAADLAGGLSVAALRRWILDCDLGLDPAHLLTWMDKGQILAARDSASLHGSLQISGTVTVIADNYGGDVVQLIYAVLAWAHATQPGIGPDAMTVSVDQLDDQMAAVEITLPVCDIVICTGDGLSPVRQPDADAIGALDLAHGPVPPRGVLHG